MEMQHSKIVMYMQTHIHALAHICTSKSIHILTQTNALTNSVDIHAQNHIYTELNTALSCLIKKN